MTQERDQDQAQPGQGDAPDAAVTETKESTTQAGDQAVTERETSTTEVETDGAGDGFGDEADTPLTDTVDGPGAEPAER